MRFTAEDVMEVHHQDGNHRNNAYTNLALLHGHCRDAVHGTPLLALSIVTCSQRHHFRLVAYPLSPLALRRLMASLPP